MHEHPLEYFSGGWLSSSLRGLPLTVATCAGARHRVGEAMCAAARAVCACMAVLAIAALLALLAQQRTHRVLELVGQDLIVQLRHLRSRWAAPVNAPAWQARGTHAARACMPTRHCHLPCCPGCCWVGLQPRPRPPPSSPPLPARLQGLLLPVPGPTAPARPGSPCARRSWAPMRRPRLRSFSILRVGGGGGLACGLGCVPCSSRLPTHHGSTAQHPWHCLARPGRAARWGRARWCAAGRRRQCCCCWPAGAAQAAACGLAWCAGATGMAVRHAGWSVV